MTILRKVLPLLAVGLLAPMTSAADDNLWLGARAGTLGIGLEATWRPIEWLDIRAGVHQYDYDTDSFETDIDYDGTLQFENYYATANFRFPLSPFRLSVGAYSNGNEIQMSSVNAPTLDIGGVTYTAQEAGTLRAVTTFDDISPYFGAGYDFELLGKLGLNLDFGVLLQGEPQVALTADGTLANTQAFLDSLAAEQAALADEADTLKLYPVVSLGVNFNFF